VGKRRNDLDRHDPVRRGRPNEAQRRYLARGLGQPGGKLPLHDRLGQRVPPRVIVACVKAGWAEPWFRNPIKPTWLVCRLTEIGRRAVVANDMGNGIPS
jgi:hypothetical protein